MEASVRFIRGKAFSISRTKARARSSSLTATATSTHAPPNARCRRSSYGRTAARQSAQGMRESRRRVPRTLHPAAAPAMLGAEAAMSPSLAAHDAAYEVRAFDTAAASENKIYDDVVARRFGFRGSAGARRGKCTPTWRTCRSRARTGAWLESGAADCRFLKPVYDGSAVRVTAGEESGGLALSVESTR